MIHAKRVPLLLALLVLVLGVVQATPAPSTKVPEGMMPVKLYYGVDGSNDYIWGWTPKEFPPTDAWQSWGGYMADQLMDHVAVAAYGYQYIIGGYMGSLLNSTVLYRNDIVSRTWTTLAPVPIALCGMGAAVIGDTIYVSGGYRYDIGANVDTLLKYSISGNTWTETPGPYPGTQNAGWFPNVVACAGSIYFLGGANTPGTGTSNRVFKYTPGSGWIEVAPMNQIRDFASCFVFHDSIWMCGGNQAGVGIANTEVYDPVSNTWTENPAVFPFLPEGRWGSGQAAYVEAGNAGIVYGGVTPAGALATNVFRFNFRTRSWQSEPCRTGHLVYRTAVAANDSWQAIVFGGSTGGFSPSDSVSYETYPPPVNRDLKVMRIVQPAASVPPGTLAPSAWVLNEGLQATAATQAMMRIGIYEQTAPVPILMPLESALVTFPNWTASPGTFPVKCSTMLPSDQRPANDFIATTTTVGGGGGGIGPDANGYIGYPDVYSWINPTGHTFIGAGDDNQYAFANPFPFWYRGVLYSGNFSVSTNGWLDFSGSTLSASYGFTYPSASYARPLVGILHNDLYLNTATHPNAGIYRTTLGTTPNRQLVITWLDAMRWSSTPSTATFQIILNEADSSIQFQYNDVDFGTPTYNGGNNAYVGTQNATGTIGLSWLSLGTPVERLLTDGSAIRWKRIAHNVAANAILSPASNPPNRAIPVSVQGNFRNTGAFTEGPFNVACTIFGLNGAIRFTGASSIASLAAGATSPAINFGNWTPTNAEPIVVKIAHDLADGVPGDNALSASFTVLPALTTGGPDAAGYRWIDNDATGGPVYNWQDITATGTPVPFTTFDNDVQMLQLNTIGFAPFRYYGTNYNNLHISTNGVMALGLGTPLLGTDTLNVACPNAATPNTIIAPFWDNLDCIGAGRVRYQVTGTAPNRVLIVSWDNVSFKELIAVPGLRFQALFYEGLNEIQFQYNTAGTGSSRDYGKTASVGIENTTGLIGLNYHSNGSPAGNLLWTGRAIRFYFSHDVGADAILAPAEGAVLPPGSTVDPIGRVKNFGSYAETFQTSFDVTGPVTYTNQQPTTSLAPGATNVLNFATSPTLSPGLYATKLKTLLGDPIPSNDSLMGTFLVMGVPTGLAPDNVWLTTSTPTLSWDALAGAGTYVIQVAYDAGCNLTAWSGTTAGTSIVTGTLSDDHYYWRVAGENAGMLGDWSAVAEFDIDVTAPVAPTLTSPADLATDVVVRPTYEWTEVTFFKGKSLLGRIHKLNTDQVDFYDIEVATDVGFSSIVYTGTSATNTYTHTADLANSATFFWHVRGTDLAGNVGAWSTPFSFTTEAPAATVLLTPADGALINDPTPDFTWAPAGTANLYHLQVATDPGFTPPLVIDDPTLTATGFTPTTDLAEGQYFWHVRGSADNGVTWGPYQTAPFDFDLDVVPPAAPTTLTPTSNEVNVPVIPNFTWTEVTFKGKAGLGARAKQATDALDRYEIEASTDPTFTTVAFSAQSEVASYSPAAPLDFLTKYYWHVRGVDDHGNIGDWAVDSFTTIIEAPAAPALVSPTNGASNVSPTGNLVWSAATRASTYDVYLDGDNPPVTLLAGDVTGTTQAYDVPGEHVYYWRVVAKNIGGNTPSTVWVFGTAGAPPPPPPGSYTPRTDSMTGVPVKDGGAMAYYDNSADGALIYAIKGGKTNEFWAYDPAETTWTKRSDVTAGTKAVGKGAAMTAGAGFVYVMKGNGGRDFYKYNATDTSWTKAKDIPLALDQTATRGKGVKAGGSLAYVHVRDSDFVYVLKGYGTDFYRYDVARDSHFSLVAAPYTSKPKYDKGSWICYDGTQYIYVMQAKYNALYRYDVTTEAWDAASTLKGMPFNSTVTGKTNKKVGDGSAAAWDGQAIFAPKGGGTQEVWKYTPGTDGDTWAELESIPQAYAAGAKKKKVKSGGAIAYYPVTGVFYIQKGNKSNQFWMYTPATGPVYGQRQNRDGVTGAGATNVATSIAVCPNPLANGCATVRYSLPKAGTVTLSVHDVTGRMVMLRTLSVNRTGAAGLDLRGLSAGVYLVKLSADDGHTASQKLVVER